MPLVNIWLHDFTKTLKEKFPELTTRDSKFTFLPTYDIDEAYAYKNKLNSCVVKQNKPRGVDFMKKLKNYFVSVKLAFIGLQSIY